MAKKKAWGSTHTTVRITKGGTSVSARTTYGNKTVTRTHKVGKPGRTTVSQKMVNRTITRVF